MAGRVPIGVGIIPGSDLGAGDASVGVSDTVDSLGNTGEYAHKLTGDEGAVEDHVHPTGVCDPATDDGFFNIEASRPTSNWLGHYITGSGGTPATAETTANLLTLKAADGAGVVADKHNNMQPYLGVYFITHTARKFYVLPA